MNYYFAPLEGITYYNFRQVHHQFYPGIDAYYTPFVVATWTHKMKARERRDILPENNAGVPVVPQILTARADEFLFCARYMASLGYAEVNLNAGCPVGTVTAKGKGAGLLRDPHQLDALLDSIFNGLEREKITISGQDGPVRMLTVSVKTRLGWEDPEEFGKILDVYRKYPVSKLIVHARTRKELYGGAPEMEAFAQAYEECMGDSGSDRWKLTSEEGVCKALATDDVTVDTGCCSQTAEKSSGGMKLCYNGDVETEEDAARIAARFPKLDGIMIGRGLLMDPGLVTRIREREDRAEEATAQKNSLVIDSGQESVKGEMVSEKSRDRVKTIHAFHDELYRRYEEQFRDDRILVDHMKELWTYLGRSFPGSGPCIRDIHKARSRIEYEAAVRVLFAGQ